MPFKNIYILKVESNRLIIEDIHDLFDVLSRDKTRNMERDFKILCYEIDKDLTPVYMIMPSDYIHLVNDAGKHFELPEPFDIWDIDSINFNF